MNTNNVAELTKKQRAILTLHDQGVDVDAISIELAVSPGQVKGQLTRIGKKVRKGLAVPKLPLEIACEEVAVMPKKTVVKKTATTKAENKKHFNEHRKEKKGFQAMLTAEEQELLAVVKKLSGIKQNKELLLTLLEAEKKRLLYTC